MNVERIVGEAGNSELWGVNILECPADIREGLVNKFLEANNTIEEAEQQLLDTLIWRKEFGALGTLNEEHDEKFNGLGWVEEYGCGVITWNIYGKIDDYGKVFGDLNAFLRWRVSIMEQGLQKLDWKQQSSLIQVHDYQNVSFLRLDSRVRTASRAVIDLFSKYYPELLSKKYFVNVPRLMSWVYALYTMLVAEKTARKLIVLTSGSELAADVGDDTLPAEYGGS